VASLIAVLPWPRRKSGDRLDALRRSLAGRYRVERKIGEGGMAEVFLAEDLKHARSVAIKVLKPEIGSAVGAARFLSEIRVTAQLRHPNILPLYASGERGGFLFYVMPFVEGETLAERLAREGPMKADEAVRLVSQLAGALDYAHERGLVHRDIKPGNIMLERGQAVLTDFGIARAISRTTVWRARTGVTEPGKSPSNPIAESSEGPDGGRERRPKESRVTATGGAIGSPLYMSPEQALGRTDLDGRTDLYSLGCVAYEMLAGAPPFVAPTALVAMARHVGDPVPPLSRRRPDLPVRLIAAVERTLAKSPDERFPDMRAFVAELAASLDGGRAPAAERDAPKPTIAVLPFVDLAGDPEQAFFASGIHDAVIGELSKISSLRPISRTTMLTYQGVSSTIAEVASRLGVSAVLEGTVLRSGDRVRISLQLYEAPESLLWTETYERDLTDVLALHADVARSVARSIDATITAAEGERLNCCQPIDPGVYELYLRGRYQSAFVPTEAYRAIRYFEEAIERAPTFGAAHAGLARRLVWLASLGLEQGLDILPRAAAAAARAHVLDPSSADALAVLGYLRFVQDWDSAGARDALEEAVRLEPGNLDALVDLASHLYSVGAFDRADEVLARIEELDPFSPPTGLFRGWGLVMSRRFDDAVASLEASWDRHPGFPYLPVFAALSEVMRGNLDRALELARDAEALDPESRTLDFLNILAAVYAWTGAAEESRQVIARQDAQLSGENGAWFRWLARLILGDEAEALRWFDLAFEQRNPMLVLLPIHPIFEIARRHPIMGERIRAMGLVPAEGLAVSPATVR